MTQCLPDRITTALEPLVCYLSFEDPECLSQARAEVRRWVTLTQFPQLKDDTELVVSELVANVKIHTTSPSALLFLYAESDGVLIQVSDFGQPRVPGAVPVLCDACSTDEAQRGLFLVGVLCQYWKYGSNEFNGTTYTAKIATGA